MSTSPTHSLSQSAHSLSNSSTPLPPPPKKLPPPPPAAGKVVNVAATIQPGNQQGPTTAAPKSCSERCWKCLTCFASPFIAIWNCFSDCMKFLFCNCDCPDDLQDQSDTDKTSASGSQNTDGKRPPVPPAPPAKPVDPFTKLKNDHAELIKHYEKIKGSVKGNVDAITKLSSAAAPDKKSIEALSEWARLPEKVQQLIENFKAEQTAIEKYGKTLTDKVAKFPENLKKQEEEVKKRDEALEKATKALAEAQKKGAPSKTNTAQPTDSDEEDDETPAPVISPAEKAKNEATENLEKARKALNELRLDQSKQNKELENYNEWKATSNIDSQLKELQALLDQLAKQRGDATVKQKVALILDGVSKLLLPELDALSKEVAAKKTSEQLAKIQSYSNVLVLLGDLEGRGILTPEGTSEAVRTMANSIMQTRKSLADIVGLPNFGLVCWFNGAIQAMYRNKSFRKVVEAKIDPKAVAERIKGADESIPIRRSLMLAEYHSDRSITVESEMMAVINERRKEKKLPLYPTNNPDQFRANKDVIAWRAENVKVADEITEKIAKNEISEELQKKFDEAIQVEVQNEIDRLTHFRQLILNLWREMDYGSPEDIESAARALENILHDEDYRGWFGNDDLFLNQYEQKDANQFIRLVIKKFDPNGVVEQVLQRQDGEKDFKIVKNKNGTPVIEVALGEGEANHAPDKKASSPQKKIEDLMNALYRAEGKSYIEKFQAEAPPRYIVTMITRSASRMEGTKPEVFIATANKAKETLIKDDFFKKMNEKEKDKFAGALKAFAERWHGKPVENITSKRNDPVIIPAHGILEGSKLDYFNNNPDVFYKLTGFEVHRGDNLKSGHYITYARGEDGRWRRYDDSVVTDLGDEIPKEVSDAYNYFWELVTPEEAQQIMKDENEKIAQRTIAAKAKKEAEAKAKKEAEEKAKKEAAEEAKKKATEKAQKEAEAKKAADKAKTTIATTK